MILRRAPVFDFETRSFFRAASNGFILRSNAGRAIPVKFGETLEMTFHRMDRAGSLKGRVARNPPEGPPGHLRLRRKTWVARSPAMYFPDS